MAENVGQTGLRYSSEPLPDDLATLLRDHVGVVVADDDLALQERVACDRTSLPVTDGTLPESLRAGFPVTSRFLPA
jgi:hypothetical protein